ncbi:MAG: hypothetical protein AAGC60_26700 [Acidobacteriota bacterium]
MATPKVADNSFRAAWQALREEVPAVPRHLDAEPGAIAALHTWTQRL